MRFRVHRTLSPNKLGVKFVLVPAPSDGTSPGGQRCTLCGITHRWQQALGFTVRCEQVTSPNKRDTITPRSPLCLPTARINIVLSQAAARSTTPSINKVAHADERAYRFEFLIPGRRTMTGPCRLALRHTYIKAPLFIKGLPGLPTSEPRVAGGQCGCRLRLSTCPAIHSDAATSSTCTAWM